MRAESCGASRMRVRAPVCVCFCAGVCMRAYVCVRVCVCWSRRARVCASAVVVAARLHFFACFDGMCECTTMLLNIVRPPYGLTDGCPAGCYAAHYSFQLMHGD